NAYRAFASCPNFKLASLGRPEKPLAFPTRNTNLKKSSDKSRALVPLVEGIPKSLRKKKMLTLTPERIHEVMWSLAAKHSDKVISQIRPESRLIQDLGADSLTVVEFSMDLEEELG